MGELGGLVEAALFPSGGGGEAGDDGGGDVFALIEYTPATQSFKFVDSYNDFEEAQMDLSAAKVQYLYSSVLDSQNTGVKKIVLVQWVGEAAPESVKAAALNQVTLLSPHLPKPPHLTITARCEEDLDLDSIKEKLSKLSVNFGRSKAALVQGNALSGKPAGPVGTNYKKADAQAEIASSNKLAFWNKTNEECVGEKRRQSEVERLDKEARERLLLQRERQEAAEREQRYAADAAEEEARVKAAREAQERARLAEKAAATAQWEKQLAEEKAAAAQGSRSGELKQARMSELSQMMEESLARTDLPQHNPADEGPGRERLERDADLAKAMAARDSFEAEMMTSSNLNPANQSAGRASTHLEEARNAISRSEFGDKRSSFELRGQAGAGAEQMQARQSYKEWINGGGGGDSAGGGSGGDGQSDAAYVPSSTPLATGITAVALYAYEAADDSEISLKIDAQVVNVEKIDVGWWRGVDPVSGRTGLFPANYVKEL